MSLPMATSKSCQIRFVSVFCHVHNAMCDQRPCLFLFEVYVSPRYPQIPKLWHRMPPTIVLCQFGQPTGLLRCHKGCGVIPSAPPGRRNNKEPMVAPRPLRVQPDKRESNTTGVCQKDTCGQQYLSSLNI